MIVNKNIPIADTNILVSFFTNDKDFNKSREILSNSVYINSFILTEFSNIIKNKYSLYKSLKSIEFILDNEDRFFIYPVVDDNLYSNALTIMNKYLDSKLSFVDCLILAQAEEYGLRVYTADIRMQNYKKVEVINPFDS